MPQRSPAARFDIPWKAVLTHAFRAFMTFYFAELSTQIDWSRRPRFLDKELAQAGFGDAPVGRVADKLVAVYLRNGSEYWVLVHIEVQAQRDDRLARRVLSYNNRIFEQFGRPVASLVVLADDDPHWRPHSFHNILLGTEMGISFAIAKLLDYADRLAMLEASRNPFALITLTHLSTQQTRQSATDRYAAKWHLTKKLYERGWSKKRIITLFKVINWMMTLPVDLEERYWRDIHRLEREREMDCLTPLEQIFLDRGRKMGVAMVLEEQLTQRFGPLSRATRKKLSSASLEELTSWSKAVLGARTLKQVFS